MFWRNCQSLSWFIKVGLFVYTILLGLIVGGTCLVLVFSRKSTLSFKFSKLDKQLLMFKLLRSMLVSRALRLLEWAWLFSSTTFKVDLAQFGQNQWLSVRLLSKDIIYWSRPQHSLQKYLEHLAQSLKFEWMSVTLQLSLLHLTDKFSLESHLCVLVSLKFCYSS